LALNYQPHSSNPYALFKFEHCHHAFALLGRRAALNITFKSLYF